MCQEEDAIAGCLTNTMLLQLGHPGVISATFSKGKSGIYQINHTLSPKAATMRIAAVSSVDMTIDPARSSAEFVMRPNPLQAAILLALGGVGLLVLMSPVALIVIDGLSNPQVAETLLGNVGSSALLALGLILGIALMIYPLRAGLARLNASAKVKMQDGIVSFERRGPLSRETWHTPLAQFCGVTHHIRATLSGARHEIILLHPDPQKDVLLHVAPRHPKEDVEFYADLLGLQVLQPRTLYSRRRQRPAPEAMDPIRARAA